MPGYKIVTIFNQAYTNANYRVKTISEIHHPEQFFRVNTIRSKLQCAILCLYKLSSPGFCYGGADGICVIHRGGAIAKCAEKQNINNEEILCMAKVDGSPGRSTEPGTTFRHMAESPLPRLKSVVCFAMVNPARVILAMVRERNTEFFEIRRKLSVTNGLSFTRKRLFMTNVKVKNLSHFNGSLLYSYRREKLPKDIYYQWYLYDLAGHEIAQLERPCSPKYCHTVVVYAIHIHEIDGTLQAFVAFDHSQRVPLIVPNRYEVYYFRPEKIMQSKAMPIFKFRREHLIAKSEGDKIYIAYSDDGFLAILYDKDNQIDIRTKKSQFRSRHFSFMYRTGLDTIKRDWNVRHVKLAVPGARSRFHILLRNTRTTFYGLYEFHNSCSSKEGGIKLAGSRNSILPALTGWFDFLIHPDGYMLVVDNERAAPILRLYWLLPEW
ncbi:uncharacterized protein LOC135491532 [Lineus longissimus]|uniref:uncharacterized protein LOC135491532 n=1 Tax=Lineus longissimus TaxID=88925 RepID=UPI002B4E514E